MRVVGFSLYSIILVSSFIYCTSNSVDKPISQKAEIVGITKKGLPSQEEIYMHLKEKADSASKYCKARGFNETYCFLVNFHIHSGKKRFFIWDFEKEEVQFSSLCAHGSGKGSTEEKPEYSNVEGSYCSSLGRYKVGVSAYSQYGIHIHYKLHGLDSTNNNAFKRIVVLHSYKYVPPFEIYPAHLPLGYSLGCPVISDETMREADAIIEKSDKPILLWIFDEPIVNS